MGLATAALVLAAGLAACLVCFPPAAEAGPLLSEERGLSAPLSDGGQLTEAGSPQGGVGPDDKKRRGGRKGNRKRAGKGGKRGGKRNKCKTPECKRERREKRKLRRKQKQERRRNKKNGGGGGGGGGGASGGGGGKKNRGGKSKRSKDRNLGEDAPAPDAAAGQAV